MSRLCLDTSAYSQFRRGHEGAGDLLDAADWIGMPAITLGELWAGFMRGSQFDRNRTELADFLSHPLVSEVIIDFDVARLFAEISESLRREGTPLPANDVWIAACAARHGATVLTFDTHFKSIDRVASVVLLEGA